MSQQNDITIDTYDKEFQTYVDKTASQVTGSVKDFLETFMGYVDKQSLILEIGSGTGRDATYIEQAGYQILRTDAANGFVQHMVSEGHSAQKLNIINETIDQKFDAILANAVFLHFDIDDFIKAINNVSYMLAENGIFAISLHKGHERMMSDHKHSARYFHEWTEKEALPFITKFGFSWLATVPNSTVGGRKEWIMLVLQKTQDTTLL